MRHTHVMTLPIAGITHNTSALAAVSKEGTTMYAAPPPPPSSSPAAPSSDDQTKIAAIAMILGVDPSDLDGLAAAVQSLLGGGGTSDDADVAASKLLTASDLKMCLSMKCRPRDFVALKMRLASGKNL